jgi:flagellar motor switch protein FliG
MAFQPPGPVETRATPEPLSGAQKAALLLLLLDEPEAAAMLARLTPEEVDAIGEAMLSVAEANPATVDRLLDEVLELAGDTVALASGPETVRTMLETALGPDRAVGVIERLGERARPPVFARLGWLQPYAIASLIETEHPQVQAVVLAHLPSERAAHVLARLPSQMQADLVRRVAMLGPVLPAAIEALDAALALRMSETPPRPAITDLGGMKRAANLINMAGLDEADALDALGNVDPAAAEILSETLFTFADLVQLDERGLQNVIRSLEAEILIPAMRAADPELKQRILAAMPARAAQALEGEIDARGPVKIEDAEAAQKAIAAATRRLAAEGVVSLPGKGPAYV